MWALHLKADSGSEKIITPEEKWIYEQSTCANDEVSGQPIASSSSAAADDIMDDDDDGDGSASEDSEETGGSNEVY